MAYKVMIATMTALSWLSPSFADDLKVGKSCPVFFADAQIGELILSKPWYHSSRSNARYIAGDNATGIGIEVHLKNHHIGKVTGLNFAGCDRFRILQVRKTSAKLLPGESSIQIDVPNESLNPFYDNAPLEHGYGLHQTPIDDSDKPWQGRVYRDADVSIYDTPYVSDSWGVEGRHIEVQFETCAVCERDNRFDSILSCGHWGYRRDYMGGMTGWSEPEFSGFQCSAGPSHLLATTLRNSHRIDYSYWIHWR